MYPLDAEKCAEINAKTQGQKAAMSMKNVRGEIVVENIMIREDSTTWFNPYNMTRRTASTNSIREIKITDYKKGFLYGLIGTGVCILAMAAVSGEEGSYGSMKTDNLEITTAGWIRFFAVTIGIAMPISGAINGIDCSYIVNDPLTPADELESRHMGKTVEVTLSSIVERGTDFVIVHWRGKDIRLLKTEYQYIATVNEGKQILVVSKDIYEGKFLGN